MLHHCVVAVGGGEFVSPCPMGIHPPLQDQSHPVWCKGASRVRFSVCLEGFLKGGISFSASTVRQLRQLQIKSCKRKKAKKALMKIKVLSLRVAETVSEQNPQDIILCILQFLSNYLSSENTKINQNGYFAVYKFLSKWFVL